MILEEENDAGRRRPPIVCSLLGSEAALIKLSLADGGLWLVDGPLSLSLAWQKRPKAGHMHAANLRQATEYSTIHKGLRRISVRQTKDCRQP